MKFKPLIASLIAAGMFSLYSCSEQPSNTINIGSFNTHIFGKSKVKKQDVMSVFADMLAQYDIVAIQEIRDKSMTSLPRLIEQINDSSDKNFDYVVSPRLGRTSSKEQYAFIYNTRTIEYTEDSFVWPDSRDIFEREPFIAQFRARFGKLDFILVNVHTKPDDATAEILALEQVVKYADNHIKDDDDVIVLGDFNADGTYFSEQNNQTGIRGSDYIWVIGDDQDTNLAASVYAYDRIVFQDALTSEDYTGEFEIFRFDSEYSLDKDQAKRVSDHYPISTRFYINRDSD